MVPKIYKDLSALENLTTFFIDCFEHSHSTSLAVCNLLVTDYVETRLENRIAVKDA